MSRVTLLFLVLAAWQAPTLPFSTTEPASNSCFAAKSVTLKEQLEKGLKARRPEEFAFIATVVDLVEKKKLERKLVDSTFLWARRKPKHKFQYFKHAMRLRAKRAGVTLN